MERGSPAAAFEERVVQIALAAAALTLVFGLFARTLTNVRGAAPLLGGETRLYWLAALIAPVGYAFAIQRVMRATPTPQGARGATGTPGTLGTLPAVALLAGVALVAWDDRARTIAIATACVFALVYAALVARRQHAVGDPAVRSGARLVTVGLTVTIAFLALGALQHWRAAAWFQPLVAGAIGATLLTSALEVYRAPAARRGAFAVAGAIVVAQAAWPLALGLASGWLAGGLLAALVGALLVVGGDILERRASVERVTRAVAFSSLAVVALIVIAR